MNIILITGFKCTSMTCFTFFQVIQRREDGSVNFFRDWEAYREGFGKITGEHWLGKPSMSLSVKQSVWKML